MTRTRETPAGFEALVEAHQREIHAYLWRWLGSVQDAEDGLQDTFLRALRAYPRLRNHKHLRAWLYRIATNVARTHHKRRLRESSQVMDLAPEVAQDGPSPHERVERDQTLRALASAVESLPPRQRASLLMRKYQGLDYASVAAALGCTEAAARANVYQALRSLRERLAGGGGEESLR